MWGRRNYFSCKLPFCPCSAKLPRSSAPLVVADGRSWFWGKLVFCAPSALLACDVRASLHVCWCSVFVYWPWGPIIFMRHTHTHVSWPFRIFFAAFRVCSAQTVGSACHDRLKFGSFFKTEYTDFLMTPTIRKEGEHPIDNGMANSEIAAANLLKWW